MLWLLFNLGLVNVRIFLGIMVKEEYINKEEWELILLLRLHKIPKISNLKAHQLIKKFGSATAVFKKEDRLINLLQFQLGDEFFSRKYLESALADLEEARKQNYSVLGYGLSSYPPLLKQCEDAPLILFCSGSIDWKTDRWIGIVGTRSASKEALLWTSELIEGLAPYKPTIISGLAYGIDVRAHQTAIECGLQTIACLGHGLKVTYPKEHSKIRRQMEERGGVISEFMPSDSPLPYKFVQRNRIISGLSEAVLVVESPQKGGSLITADLANSYHREVYALPARISDPHQGTNHLIRDCKAQLVSCAQDLIDFLGY